MRRGADATKFLQGLVTNDVRTLQQPGDCMYAAFLSTKGRVTHEAIITMGGQGGGAAAADQAYLIETDGALLPALRKHMTVHKLRSKVTITERSDLSAFAILPPVSSLSSATPELSAPLQELLQKGGAALARPSEAGPGSAQPLLFADPRSPRMGLRLLLPQTATGTAPASAARCCGWLDG